MVTFEARLENIKSVGDYDKQLILAGKYANVLRKKSKTLKTLSEKIAAEKNYLLATKVRDKLLAQMWVIQDFLDRADNAS
jgi:hypothetical protein